MALVLSIGGGAISLVQNGVGARSVTTVPTASLPVASTWGTTLVALLGNTTGVATTTTSVDPTVSVGWRQVATHDQGVGNAHIEVWVYENNIGGITTATFTSASATWTTHISEWNNVKFTTAYQGNNDATSGTTLPLNLAVNVPETNDLAIAVWMQLHAANTATFTTPGGWTRLISDGATSLGDHIDAEYMLNPTSGTNAAVTLTSNRTTTSASGLEVVLTHPAAAVDQSAFIEYGSMVMKFNTLDFNLIDPATVPAIGDNVSWSDTSAFSFAWTGRVVSIAKSDIVDLPSGHKRVIVTAINQAPQSVAGTPINFDATGVAGVPYRLLTVRTTLNTDGTYNVYGTLEEETNPADLASTLLQPGMVFTLTSANLGYAATSFTAQNVTVRWQGSASAKPTYFVEFGSALLTGHHRILTP